MIDSATRGIAERLFDRALLLRQSTPRDEVLQAQLAIIEPSNASADEFAITEPGDPRMILLPANDLLGPGAAPVIEAVKRGIAVLAPKAVLFWAETWVASATPDFEGAVSEHPEREDALIMALSDIDADELWVSRFAWAGDACAFQPRVLCHTALLGPRIDWFEHLRKQSGGTLLH